MSLATVQPEAVRRRPHLLRGRVVVITGASSGIGRATARGFACCGARLVLAARNEDALHAVAGECAQRGAHALVQRTDVTDPKSVEELARATTETFGRIDVWVNNAGVGLFGPFTQADIEMQRRVVETNLFGTMHAAAAVLPVFLEQGSGTMITNISLGGFMPVPFAAAYTAGKFGLRGFMAALREEFRDYPRIRLCSLFPAVVDTPGFEHGANVSGARLKPVGLVYPPQRVAAAIVRLALRPRAEVSVGWPAHAAKVAHGLAPVTTQRLTGAVLRAYLRRAPAAGRTVGNLFSASAGTMAPRGKARAPRIRRSAETPALFCGVLAFAGAALFAAGWLRGASNS
jgi:short-subunit dehydrogenase